MCFCQRDGQRRWKDVGFYSFHGCNSEIIQITVVEKLCTKALRRESFSARWDWMCKNRLGSLFLVVLAVESLE